MSAEREESLAEYAMLVTLERDAALRRVRALERGRLEHFPEKYSRGWDDPRKWSEYRVRVELACRGHVGEREPEEPKP